MLSQQDEDLILKTNTFRIFKKWVQFRKKFRYSLNICERLTTGTSETKIVFRFFQRWKNYTAQIPLNLIQLPYSDIQVRAINAETRLATQKDLNIHTALELDQIKANNDYLNSRFINARRLALTHLTSNLQNLMSEYFHKWRVNTQREALQSRQDVL